MMIEPQVTTINPNIQPIFKLVIFPGHFNNHISLHLIPPDFRCQIWKRYIGIVILAL